MRLYHNLLYKSDAKPYRPVISTNILCILSHQQKHSWSSTIKNLCTVVQKYINIELLSISVSAFSDFYISLYSHASFSALFHFDYSPAHKDAQWTQPLFEMSLLMSRYHSPRSRGPRLVNEVAPVQNYDGAE